MYIKEEYQIMVNAVSMEDAIEKANEAADEAKKVPNSEEFYVDKSGIYEVEFGNQLLTEEQVAFDIVHQNGMLYLSPNSERALKYYPILNECFDATDPHYTCGASEHIVGIITRYIENNPDKLKEGIAEIARVARYFEVELG